MAITLEHELETLAVELARVKGVTVEQAVREALELELERARRALRAAEDATPGGLTRDMAEQIFGY